MKGGSIDPPDPAKIVIESTGWVASMKGGSIDPPDGQVAVGGGVEELASMKGGSIDPPDIVWAWLLDEQVVAASMKGGSIDPPDPRPRRRAPVRVPGFNEGRIN